MTNAITTYDPEEVGGLGLAAEDIRPPRLRFSGKEGHFTFIGDDGSTDEIIAVPLRLVPDTRVKFSDDENSSDIDCRSNNNRFPVDLDQAAKIGAGPSCQECPYASFEKDETGRTIAPACTLFRNLAMASLPESDDEEPTPFIFSFKSTSIKTMMNALNAVELKRRKARPPVPGYAFALELSAGALTGQGKQKYYPLAAKLADGRVPDELLPSYRALWQWMTDSMTRIDFTAPAEASAESPQEGGVLIDAELVGVSGGA